MSYEIPTEQEKIDQLQKELNLTRDILFFNSIASIAQQKTFGVGRKSNNLGSEVGVKSFLPIETPISKIDDDDVDTGVLDRLNIQGLSTIVSGAASTIAVKFIQGLGDLVNGKYFMVTPKTGKSIELQTGGDIDIPANVTVTDDQFVLMSFYKDTGKVKCVTGTGGSSGAAFPIEPTITDNSDTWSGTQTLNLATGDGHVYKWIMDQNLTFAATVTNRPASGTQRTFELEFVHDGIGGTFTVTLPNNFTDETGATLTGFDVGVDKTVILTCRINDGTNFLVVLKNVTAASGGAFLPLAGGTMSGNINLGGQNLTNIGDINDFIAVGGFTLAANQDIIIAGSGSDVGTTGQFLSQLYVGTINLGDPTDTQTIIGVPTGIEVNVKTGDTFLVKVNAVDQLTISATDVNFHVNTTSNQSTINFTDGGSISSLPDRIQISVPLGDIITCRVNSIDQITISETAVDMKGNVVNGLTTMNFDDGNFISTTPTEFIFSYPTSTDIIKFREGSTDKVTIDGNSNALILHDFFLSILNVTSGNSLSIIKLAGTSGTDITDPDSIQIQIAAVDQLTITATDIDFHVNTTSNMSTLNFTDGGAFSSLPDRIQVSVPLGDIFTYRINAIEEFEIHPTVIKLKGNTLEFDTNQTIDTDSGGFNFVVPGPDTYEFFTDTSDLNFLIENGRVLIQHDTIDDSQLEFLTLPASPLTGILGSILWRGENSTPLLTTYAEIRGEAINITAGSAHGRIGLYPSRNGVPTNVIEVDGNAVGGKLGFFNSGTNARGTVTGSRAGNAALASLLSALSNHGLIIDSSTA